MAVIDTQNLSRDIILNLIRNRMRTDLDNPDIPLTDPKKEQRGTNAPMIMTSFPMVNVFFPHVIVEEFGMLGDRLDSRVDLFENDYSVIFSIHAETNHEVVTLKDQVRDWIQRNIEFLNRSGYCEIEFTSVPRASFEMDQTIRTEEVVITGKAYTTFEYDI